MSGTKGVHSNENGDLTKIQWNAIQATDFVYDVMGNLKEVTLPSGDVIKYFVDGMDRRVVKQVNNVFQWRYLYEGQYRVAAQLNGSHAVQKEFVYATRINVPDYMIVGGNKFRIITDHLGSPRLVVRVDNGNVAQRIDYTVLGAVTNDTNPNFQPFGFAGGIYDNGTQLVRFGARDYDPRSTGRWTTKDPIRFDGGDTNLYGYVLNDPVNWIDENGLNARSATGGGGGRPDMGVPGGGGSAGSARITGFTRHGQNRAIGDGGKRAGTSPKAMLDAVNNPICSVRQSDGALRLEGRDATVILNPDGAVRTTWPTSSSGVRGGGQ